MPNNEINSKANKENNNSNQTRKNRNNNKNIKQNKNKTEKRKIEFKKTELNKSEKNKLSNKKESKEYKKKNEAELKEEKINNKKQENNKTESKTNKNVKKSNKKEYINKQREKKERENKKIEERNDKIDLEKIEKTKNKGKNKRVIDDKEELKNKNSSDKNIKEDSKDEEQKEKDILVEKEHVKLIKLEDIKNIFKRKNKIPKEDLKKIHKPVWINILVTITVVAYFGFLILGFYNIEKNIYQTDLKVFVLITLFLSIIMLEKAYEKDSGKIAIYGIETIVIAILTIALIYVNIMMTSNYVLIVMIMLGVLVAYYLIKSIVINIRGKKKYFVNDMKEIMNTDE